MMPMARHILTVCIFCFICATHSPCASHAAVNNEQLEGAKLNVGSSDPPLSVRSTRDKLTFNSGNNNDDDSARKSTVRPFLDDLNNNNSGGDSINNNDNNLIINQVKTNSDNNNNNEDFLRRIFLKFGDGESMSMEGFERFMEEIDRTHGLSVRGDLQRKVDLDDFSSRSTNANQAAANETCTNRSYLTSLVESKLNSTVRNVTYAALQSTCPAILFSLISTDCPPHRDNHIIHIHDIHDESKSPNLYVWLYSTIAVIIISACGALALVIIPVMQKKFYKPMLQFLVALAVGTLAGDALLHLLPHAMTSGGHQHGHEDNHENVWKGFVAMLGLTFFFIVEKSIPFITKWKNSKQKKGHAHVKVLNTGMDIVKTNETQCNDKYNAYNRCYKDIVDDPSTTFLEVDEQSNNLDKHYRKMDSVKCPYNSMRAQEMKIIENGNDDYNHDQDNSYVGLLCRMDKNQDPNAKDKLETNQNMTECPNELNSVKCTEINKMLPQEHVGEREADYTVILREHGSDHHGHSHTHGHVHAAPKNFSSVAWMVIMGDGLHNFTDGMAIGAAFSSSLAGGFSTAVAVFCHELPHELGDFAMLLKAGMSINQALYYNFLSSVLCILGNLVGIWLGNTEYASSWVFAVAAGTFVYIALVDMIPELSSAHEDEGDLMQCFLHLGGLVLGFGIMTLIAIFEDDLRNIFNDNA